jgi:hypothetical protein
MISKNYVTLNFLTSMRNKVNNFIGLKNKQNYSKPSSYIISKDKVYESQVQRYKVKSVYFWTRILNQLDNLQC